MLNEHTVEAKELLNTGTICTYAGGSMNVIAPNPEDFNIEDIAHALSLLCRWNGHCTMFYSVAEHSVRASRLVPQNLALTALLHDAAEAYIGDCPKPVKNQMKIFETIEEHLMHAMSHTFDIELPLPKAVKDVDEVLCNSEAAVLMPKATWVNPDLVIPLPGIGWHPYEAEMKFLTRYEQCLSST